MQISFPMATIYRSSIGKKAIMAVTGLVGLGFVVVHMYGNLKVFYGAAYFNEYAEGLRELGAPIFSHTHLLWIMRIVLILSVVLHVWAAWTLYQQARKARPSKYAVKRTLQANYAVKTIRLGGVVIFFFILFHLMQLTWGTPGAHNDFIPGDAYHNLVVAFQSPLTSLFYIVAVTVLGFHLYHGTWSMFQTLGFLNEKYDGAVRIAGLALAVIISVGFAIVPLAVMVGYVQ